MAKAKKTTSAKSKAQSKAAAGLPALDFLAAGDAPPPGPIAVLVGNESLLRSQVLAELRRRTLGDDDGQFSLTTLDGTTAELRDMLDELSTVALFGAGRRMVVVEEADDFVSRFRQPLEKYFARPAPHGLLVLQVGSFPSNTRLFKMARDVGLVVDCSRPSPARLISWLIEWSAAHYSARLDRDAAETLVERIEPNMGLLDQELAKLALLAGEGVSIDAALVDRHVGTWRTRTTWDMLDAALAGKAVDALAQLDRLLRAGEAPIAILAQIASPLRRFATATRLVQRSERAGRRMQLRAAVVDAGFQKWPAAIAKAERQLRHLGRVRGGWLLGRLLEADLALKGQRSAPSRARIEIERLLVELAAPTPRPPR